MTSWAWTSQESLLIQPENPVALCPNFSFPGIFLGKIHSLMSNELYQSLAAKYTLCALPQHRGGGIRCFAVAWAEFSFWVSAFPLWALSLFPCLPALSAVDHSRKYFRHTQVSLGVGSSRGLQEELCSNLMALFLDLAKFILSCLYVLFYCVPAVPPEILISFSSLLFQQAVHWAAIWGILSKPLMDIWKSLTFSTLALFHGMQSLCHPLSSTQAQSYSKTLNSALALWLPLVFCFLSFCLKEHNLCAQNFPVSSQ